MKQFDVYEQRAPRGNGLEFKANLVLVGRVSARDFVEGIEAARQLTKWPVLEPR